MKGFDAQAGSTPSSASPMSGGAGCCESGSPTFPSMTTWRMSDYRTFTWEEDTLAPTLNEQDSQISPLVCWQAASPAKTCPSPDDEQGSPGNAPASSTSSHESQTLFDPAGFSSRTYPDFSPRTAVGTSESCLERWPTSGTAWRGGFSTHVSSECRSDAGGCSSSELSLTAILEPPQSVPGRYSLSARAAIGILRRAEKRGRTLPAHLWAALQAVANASEKKNPERLSPASAASEAVARTTTTDRADD
jgi:hypothetical protein